MSTITFLSDAEYKAHQNKVKPFQTAIDLVTLAQRCTLFGWSVNSPRGKITSAEFEKGSKAEIQEILTRHGISGEWKKALMGNEDVFFLPTTEAAKHPLLVSMRAVKGEAGITHPQNLVLQLAQYMPQSQK